MLCNSHPTVTENTPNATCTRGRMLQNLMKYHNIFTIDRKKDSPTDVSRIYSSSGMLKILMNIQNKKAKKDLIE